MYFSLMITIALIIVGTILLLNDKEAIGLVTIFLPSIFQFGGYLYSKSKDKSQSTTEED